MAETPPKSMNSTVITASKTSQRRAVPLENLRRMLLVTGNYIHLADGASRTLHQIVDALEARGVEVAVVAPTTGPSELPPAQLMFDIPSFRGPVQGYRVPLGLGRSAMERIRRFDPQLVHVASPDPASVMAMRFARRHGLPVTSTFHTNFPSYLNHWGPITSAFVPLAWKLMRWFYGQCDRVYVPTESIGEELRAHAVLDEWAILARGVDEAAFSPRHRSEKWRDRHGIRPGEKVVLFCARIVWEKGLRTLVQTLDRLKARGCAFRVVIVGDGVQHEWLRSRLPDAIFTGFLGGAELASAYASADLFLYPSTTDTFGNVTLEALASGLPVVGARAPGTRSLIEEGISGILVDPDDAAGMAAACERLLTDEVLRRRMSHHAVERSRQFQWTRILDQFARSLDQIVSTSRTFTMEPAPALRSNRQAACGSS